MTLALIPKGFFLRYAVTYNILFLLSFDFNPRIKNLEVRDELLRRVDLRVVNATTKEVLDLTGDLPKVLE